MNILKVIQEHGWTLERLAAEMTNKEGGKGLTQPTISKIINGNPTINKLKEIASIIGVSLSELVADEPDQSKQEVICPHCGQKVAISVKVEVTP